MTENNPIILNSDDFKALIVCAFRYALSRRSYMPSWIAGIIRKHVNDIDIYTKNLIIEEINNYVTYEHSVWNELKLYLEEHK